MITLEQARSLVASLEANDQTAANALLVQIYAEGNKPLFNEIGKLTRKLHDSIVDFQFDPKIKNIAVHEIPDAKESLNFVLEKTEQAANRTMDAIESVTPITERIQHCLNSIHPQWKALMSGKIELIDFKKLCHEINGLINQIDTDNEVLNQQLTEILMSQSFQDLTGQVIRRVIELLRAIEIQLVEILTSFEFPVASDASEKVAELEDKIKAEGPIVNQQEREEKQVMQNQDEVDDLLSSLGF